jgi:hypothetical protein
LLPKSARQLIGPPLQFPVGHLPAGANQGHGLRAQVRLMLEQFVQQPRLELPFGGSIVVRLNHWIVKLILQCNRRNVSLLHLIPGPLFRWTCTGGERLPDRAKKALKAF